MSFEDGSGESDINSPKCPRGGISRGWKLGIAALVLAGVGAVSFPFIRTAYKRHKAGTALTASNEARSKLQEDLTFSRHLLRNNAFLMTGAGETAPLEAEITDSEEKLHAIDTTIQRAAQDEQAGNYDDARTLLDESFGLEEGTRETPTTIAHAEQQDLKEKVVSYVTTKRGMRDAAIRNEWMLLTRLKHPHVPGAEKDAKVASLPDEYYRLIPIKTAALEKALCPYPDELCNTMGVALAKRVPLLEHILSLGDSRIGSLAQGHHDRALAAYSQVRTLNDAITIKGERAWYRAEKHDGTYDNDDYKALLGQQEAPLAKMHAGDNELRALDEYFDGLHQQRFTYVSEHTDSPKSFKHTRTVSRLKTVLNHKGNLETKLVFEDEDYHTHGREFFYTLATVTPQGTSSQSIRVGEIDGGSDWSYRDDEQVGWVREWKRLHQDNTQIIRGGSMNSLHCRIEKESAACESSRQPLF